MIRPQLVRHYASARRAKHCTVQLLRDHANVGQKGEIVQVLASAMRNYLHRDNGAAYVLAGEAPRIPVVEAKKQLLSRERAAAEAKKVVVVKAPEAKGPQTPKPALSLEALSQLIAGRKNTNTAKLAANITSTTPELISYESLESIPANFLFRATTDSSGALETVVDKTAISKRIFGMTEVDVPAGLMTLSYVSPAGRSYAVEAVDFIGTYKVTISVPGEAQKIHRSLLVKSVNFKNQFELGLDRPQTVAAEAKEEEAK
ncbi:hypothetical protein BABINDRAFT_10894 [Babjeviella inositovora NRRL Y-12698]|uniref:Ribosomal protein L9 domain-containing protein n=1 Tax=Babjeviella inositovora NRRL Y-12698 TaxID=984486 RepID=A0A1E3QXS4_9ASCO|nr:uncharacterized protein BABINDRAFT_10894 [Babjeviella inositovora NRRL Y-12698]ODQ82468.1 hypothetical protein BABINDRAFT_10894 [Babjeviella inositovora NRRL Y-12698]